ncbi:glutathione S-transferase family protein [Allosphingosinicella sp.]|uniref:glutathione S-transferase family protein n=1 Tax=Allosphingosinicella sp. TaxID=2823234 RepID=UPI002FC16E2B
MALWRLYGARGWGSTLAEGVLAWAGVPFEFEDVEGFDTPGPERDLLLAVNPLARVPTLVAPGGAVLTESAAIVLHLAELHPEAKLAPSVADSKRPAFLNRLIWFVSAVYPTFTYRDYPERWAPGAAEQLTERVDAFRLSLWHQFEEELGNGPWILGDEPSALDLYVTVMSRWRPRRAWFAEHCPKLHAIALKGEALPQLAPVMRRNFPE